MVLEVGLVHHVVYETGGVLHACSIGCGVGTVQGQVEVEVRELLLDLCEVLQVEGFHEGAGAIEEVHGLLGLQGLEQVHDVAAKGSHTGAAAHEDVLLRVGVVLREQELTVRAGNHHLVSGLAGEHIGGCDSRRNTGYELEHALGLGAVERRGCDTHVELDHVFFGRIRGHGVGADGGSGVLELQGSNAVLLPVALVDIGHTHVGEIGLILGDVNLDVFTALEVDVFAFGEFYGEFLDEGGYVLVGDNLALEFLHAESAFGNGNLDVVLDLDLAAEAPAFLDLLAGEETGLGGENGSAAFDDLQFALAAVGLAAAGGGKEDAVVGEGVHDVSAGSDLQFLGPVVDVDLDGTGRSEGGLDPQKERHQNKRHYYDDCDRSKNCITHISVLLQ